MEVRERDKDIGMTSSIGYNQESSFKHSAAPIISTAADRRINETVPGSAILSPSSQTLDHHQHQLNVQQESQRLERDPNPDPDPDHQLASATIAGTSNSKAPLAQPPPPRAEAQPTASATNSAISIRYRDCLKNHAASNGGHVLDGCGEFMPSGEEGTLEALKCAACECHRNFHRKEIAGETQSMANCYYAYNSSQNNRRRTTIHPTQPPTLLPTLPHQQQQQHHKYPHVYSHGFAINPSTGPMQPMMMAFGGSSRAPAESSSEDLNMFQSSAGPQAMAQPSFSVSKKRFRTKFTKEQKGRMHEFAEKLGWKIPKKDEQEVQQFCNEVGVKRQVFKVWMHNNKQATKKQQL